MDFSLSLKTEQRTTPRGSNTKVSPVVKIGGCEPCQLFCSSLSFFVFSFVDCFWGDEKNETKYRPSGVR